MDYTESITEYRKSLRKNKDLRSSIIMSTRGKVEQIARSLNHPDHFNDLVHEGYISVMACMDSFNPNQAIPFLDYAIESIRIAMILYLLEHTASHPQELLTNIGADYAS